MQLQLQNFPELFIGLYSYSSFLSVDYFHIQGRPFTGTHPPFPHSSLFSYPILCHAVAEQVRCTPGKTALLGAERATPLENSTFGCRSSKIRGKTTLLGAERAKSLGYQFRTPRVWIGILVRNTIQVKFRGELLMYAFTVDKFSGISFIISCTFGLFKN